MAGLSTSSTSTSDAAGASCARHAAVSSGYTSASTRFGGAPTRAATSNAGVKATASPRISSHAPSPPSSAVNAASQTRASYTWRAVAVIPHSIATMFDESRGIRRWLGAESDRRVRRRKTPNESQADEQTEPPDQLRRRCALDIIPTEPDKQRRTRTVGGRGYGETHVEPTYPSRR